MAHRLIWRYKTGKFPKHQIDHIDHNRNNNVFSNLREVSNQDNAKNSSKNKNNTSGTVGVSKGKRGKWRAHIKVDYKYISLGEHINIEDAIIARKKAEVKYKFHKNHGVTNDIS